MMRYCLPRLIQYVCKWKSPSPVTELLLSHFVTPWTLQLFCDPVFTLRVGSYLNDPYLSDTAMAILRHSAWRSLNQGSKT